MTIRYVSLGSVGPYIYDDSDFDGLHTTGQLAVEEAPTEPEHVMRLADMTGNTEQTFSITGTGFASDPTVTAHYVVSGKQVTLHIPQITGTSDDTTFTLTGLPTAIQPKYLSHDLKRAVDNGAAVTAVLRLNAGVSIIDIIQAATGTWVNSGTKTLEATTVTYIIS